MMTDDELYDHAQRIWGAVEQGGWASAVAAAQSLADQAVAEALSAIRDSRIA
jgi:hypothetical protein